MHWARADGNLSSPCTSALAAVDSRATGNIGTACPNVIAQTRHAPMPVRLVFRSGLSSGFDLDGTLQGHFLIPPLH